MPVWPSGELRLEGIAVTTNPDEADIFVCPGNLSIFQDNGTLNRDRLYKLPYLATREARHVFFDVSDNFKTPIGLPCLFIRCDARAWMLPVDTGTIQIAWPVEDYEECVEPPEDGFKFDVSFQGWLSSDVRIAAATACNTSKFLHSDIAAYPDFTGYIFDTPEGVRRRAEFRRSMRESRLCLCPESIAGVLPYRFFEALSAGRVPLLVSTAYVLPFADDIPYSNFIIRVEANDAAQADKAAIDFVQDHSDAALHDIGLEARFYWEQFLDPKNWATLMSKEVQKKLQHAPA